MLKYCLSIQLNVRYHNFLQRRMNMEKLKFPDTTQMYYLGFKEKEDDYGIIDEKTGKVNRGHYERFIKLQHCIISK